MRKMALALACAFAVLFHAAAFAAIHVDPRDIQIYTSNFADQIIQNLNETGEADSVVYAYLITSINQAWNTYANFPLFVYSESGTNAIHTTLKKGDSRFDLDVVKLIEVQSKARLLRAIYTSMKEIDLSNVSEPAWLMVAIQAADDVVVYLLEVNPGGVNCRKLEEEVVGLLKKRSYMDAAFHSVFENREYQITIATYVKQYDELVIDILFADRDGNINGEAILIRDQIFGKSRVI